MTIWSRTNLTQIYIYLYLITYTPPSSTKLKYPRSQRSRRTLRIIQRSYIPHPLHILQRHAQKRILKLPSIAPLVEKLGRHSDFLIDLVMVLLHEILRPVGETEVVAFVLPAVF